MASARSFMLLNLWVCHQPMSLPSLETITGRLVDRKQPPECRRRRFAGVAWALVGWASHSWGLRGSAMEGAHPCPACYVGCASCHRGCFHSLDPRCQGPPGSGPVCLPCLADPQHRPLPAWWPSGARSSLLAPTSSTSGSGPSVASSLARCGAPALAARPVVWARSAVVQPLLGRASCAGPWSSCSCGWPVAFARA
jgi:hypothetical protein